MLKPERARRAGDGPEARKCDYVFICNNCTWPFFNRSETCQASPVSNPDVEDTIYDDIDQVISTIPNTNVKKVFTSCSYLLTCCRLLKLVTLH